MPETDLELRRILHRLRLAPHRRREIEEMWQACPPEERAEALDCLLECGTVLEWRAENRDYSIAAAAYLCPLLSARSPSVEARHARRKGARHRGEDADSAPLNAKRPSGNWSADRKTAVRTGKNRTPILGGSPLHKQAASATGHLAGARLRAPATRTRGDFTP